ncbi:thioredoxin family protein [uncultured Endozoicomonas sp.]|uniref:thioredoxin family protein n=1 Tax=uncultured Endozoicomonas sp. TaxID=432652 RepID=UPI002616F896|nr:thioredoxin family protein [uncultured Endozoicomonas sp.]
MSLYGPGCKNCTTTAELIAKIAEEANVEIELKKVTDLETMMHAGVVSTLAISIDGVLVHNGSAPAVEKVREFLS